MRASLFVLLLLSISCSKSEDYHSNKDFGDIDLPPEYAPLVYSKPKYYNNDELVAFLNVIDGYNYKVIINENLVDIPDNGIIRYQIEGSDKINIQTTVTDKDGRKKEFVKNITTIRSGVYQQILTISDTDLYDVVPVHRSSTHRGAFSQSFINAVDSIMKVFGGPAEFEASEHLSLNILPGIHGDHNYIFADKQLISIEITMRSAAGDRSLVGEDVYLSNAISIFGQPKSETLYNGVPTFDFSTHAMIITLSREYPNSNATMKIVRR